MPMGGRSPKLPPKTPAQKAASREKSMARAQGQKITNSAKRQVAKQSNQRRDEAKATNAGVKRGYVPPK